MASSLEAAIRSANPAIDLELIEGSGGIFEVKKDGKLIFSKRQAGRFPTDEEILQQLA